MYLLGWARSSIFVAAHEIFSYGMWDLVPQSGVEPGPLALGAQEP